MDQEIRVAEGDIRLDRFLALRFPDFSRAHWKEQILRGHVMVNGMARPADYQLRGGEVVSVRGTEFAWKNVSFDHWVLFEDRDILILNKPAGLLMHPMGESWLKNPEACWSESEPNLAGILLRYRPEIIKSGTLRCGLVHRLDRETSGLLVVAKNKQAYEHLTKAFAKRRVDKRYRVVVLGNLERNIAVEAPLGRKPGHRKIRVNPWGKSAETDFRVVEKGRGATLIEAHPKTGRTHQIRAHLAHIHYPVLGDLECPEVSSERLRALNLPVAPRMMLHAYRLIFAHPRTSKQVEFRVFAPRDFRDYWKRLRREENRCVPARGLHGS